MSLAEYSSVDSSLAFSLMIESSLLTWEKFLAWLIHIIKQNQLKQSLIKTFTLSNLSPIFVRINCSLPLPISLNTIKNKLLKQVNKTNGIYTEACNVFESISISKYLQPILEMFENSTSKLSSMLSTNLPDYGSLFSKI